MKLVITIDCDNEAFNGQDCGTEIANILNRIMRSMEFESKKELVARMAASRTSWPTQRQHRRQSEIHLCGRPGQRRSNMTQPELDAARYFRHAGWQCPVCLLEGAVWHEHDAIRASVVHDVSLLLVPCHCTLCPATWVETYRLVAVYRDRQEATAAAEQTYRGGS